MGCWWVAAVKGLIHLDRLLAGGWWLAGGMVVGCCWVVAVEVKIQLDGLLATNKQITIGAPRGDDLTTTRSSRDGPKRSNKKTYVLIFHVLALSVCLSKNTMKIRVRCIRRFRHVYEESVCVTYGQPGTLLQSSELAHCTDPVAIKEKQVYLCKE